MQEYLPFILKVAIIMSLIGFCLMGLDKAKAKKEGARRIPEKTLMGIALLLGSPGVYTGMRLFHHKTLHKKFYIGVPVIFFMELALLGYLLYR